MQLFLSDTDEVPAAVEFGLTIDNLTLGQPITPPLAVVHDPNVDVLVYDSPDELEGIADLAEGGARDALAATLRTRPGVVAVKNLDAVGPIPAGTSLIADASGVLGARVSVVGYVRLHQRRLHPGCPPGGGHGGRDTTGVRGRGGHRLGFREQRRDRGHRAVPRRRPGGILPRAGRGLQVGPRRHHQAARTWTRCSTAGLPRPRPGSASMSRAGRRSSPLRRCPCPPPFPQDPGVPSRRLPETGDYAPPVAWILAAGLAGALLVLSGSMLVARQRVRRDRYE